MFTLKRAVWILLIGMLFVAEPEPCRARIDSRQAVSIDGYEQVVFGRSRNGKPLVAFRSQASPDSDCLRILLIDRRMNQEAENLADVLMDLLKPLSNSAQQYVITFVPSQVLSHVPSEHWLFPPEGKYYSTKNQVECQYLWRWIGKTGFDQVIVLSDETEDSLCQALDSSSILGMGKVPAQTMKSERNEFSSMLLKTILQCQKPSEVQRALSARRERSPQILIQQLLNHYGNKLNSVAYIPALAVIAKLEFAEQTNQYELEQQVENLTSPYCLNQRSSFPAKPNGSHLAGHLVFAEVALKTGNEQAKQLVIKAADCGFDKQGMPLSSMPFHNQMSDAVFMGTPILAAAGLLSGEEKYFQQANQHLGVIQNYCLREDGLYRHSPLNEAAWGRGNGFPALGLALCLKYLPEDHPLHPVWKQALKSHLMTLLKHQDAEGMWHQIIDHPESYQELTSTCMISFALLLSQEQNWFPELDFTPAIQKAWQAVKLRIGPQGKLIDVCTGTGKQPRYEDYFYREALMRNDDRGGAMALLFAVKMLPLE